MISRKKENRSEKKNIYILSLPLFGVFPNPILQTFIACDYLVSKNISSGQRNKEKNKCVVTKRLWDFHNSRILQTLSQQ